MQFQVPQFIETEDKIVGPLTLRQFLYLGAIGGVGFMLFFIIPVFWLWLFLMVFLAGAGSALAFIKINGRPLTKIASSAFKFYWQPQTFVWQPKNPEVKKEEVIGQMAKPGFSLENIIMGLALKGTWQKLQTGTKQSLIVNPKQIAQKIKERYQIFEKITGERQAARRVDYR